MLFVNALILLAAPQEAPAAAPAPVKKERKVCRSTQNTGSRMGGGGRECRTKAEWAQIDAANVSGFERSATSMEQRRD